MQLIETKTVSTEVAAVEFASIPQTYTDLLILISARTTVAGTTSNVLSLTLNGAGTNRTFLRIAGDGSAVTTLSGSTDSRISTATGPNATANTFSNCSIYLPNYSGATIKTYGADNTAESNTSTIPLGVNMYAGLWNDIAAITSLAIQSNLNFVADSSVSLYGILKGSDGITTAT